MTTFTITSTYMCFFNENMNIPNDFLHLFEHPVFYFMWMSVSPSCSFFSLTMTFLEKISPASDYEIINIYCG